MSKIISFPTCHICLEKIEFTINFVRNMSMEEKERQFEKLCEIALKEHIAVIHEGKKSEELKF